MRWIVGGRAVERGAAATSQMGRFETELLAGTCTLSLIPCWAVFSAIIVTKLLKGALWETLS